jgi:hypothetical protein
VIHTIQISLAIGASAYGLRHLTIFVVSVWSMCCGDAKRKHALAILRILRDPVRLQSGAANDRDGG